MSYLVLARKWRPQRFEDLIGQDPIVKVLKNSIEQGKLAHAYVFSGPRGVGKTSTARILAKTLNCQGENPSEAPCGKCVSCTSIAEGSDIDVTEIDGASNNSVDNIRDLRERVKYAASSGKHKVYIIDEAHMLSTSAFNALLKTLEEPPPHVIFVMATTEARKIPATVMSRCQHMPFRRVSVKSIKERLAHIAASEGINITDGALSLVARAADGSIRDSLTLLDQVTSFSSDVDEQSIKSLLDIADSAALADTAEAVLRGERETILRVVEGLVEHGTDLRAFAKDLVKFFRDALVTKIAPSNEGLLELSDEERAAIERITDEFGEQYITLVLSEIIKTETEVRMAFSARVSLEMALLRISYLSSFSTINEAIEALGGKTSQAPGQPAPKRPMKDNYRATRAITTSDEPAPSSMPDTVKPSEKANTKTKAKTKTEPKPESKPVSKTAAEISPKTWDKTSDKALDKTDSEKPLQVKEAAQTFFTDATILKALVERLDSENPPLSAKLGTAKAKLTTDKLTLTFGDKSAEICAKPFKDNPEILEKLTSELRDIPTKIEIHITHSAQSESATEIRTRVKSDPVIAEALDLFEGRIVHVRKLDNE